MDNENIHRIKSKSKLFNTKPHKYFTRSTFQTTTTKPSK